MDGSSYLLRIVETTGPSPVLRAIRSLISLGCRRGRTQSHVFRLQGRLAPGTPPSQVGPPRSLLHAPFFPLPECPDIDKPLTMEQGRWEREQAGARDGIPDEGRGSPFRFEFARLGVQRTQWEYLLTNLRLFREMYLHITGGINIKGSRSAATERHSCFHSRGPSRGSRGGRGGPVSTPRCTDCGFPDLPG